MVALKHGHLEPATSCEETKLELRRAEAHPCMRHANRIKNSLSSSVSHVNMTGNKEVVGQAYTCDIKNMGYTYSIRRNL